VGLLRSKASLIDFEEACLFFALRLARLLGVTRPCLHFADL
jgi:hypothetical protein